jgi:hypothetical protein
MSGEGKGVRIHLYTCTVAIKNENKRSSKDIFSRVGNNGCYKFVDITKSQFLQNDQMTCNSLNLVTSGIRVPETGKDYGPSDNRVLRSISVGTPVTDLPGSNQ